MNPETQRAATQAIVDAANAALLLVDAQDRVVLANRWVERLFDLQPAELLGHPFDEVFARLGGAFEAPERFGELVAQLRDRPDAAEVFDAMGPHETYERMLKTAGRSPRYLSIFSVPLHDASGGDLGRLWVCSDVTKLREADEQLHTIVEVSPVPLIITRVEDGEILFANEPLGQLTGHPAEELVGRRTPDFYHDPSDRQVVLERLAREGTIKNHEVRLRRRDGSTFWALLSLVTADVGGTRAVIGAVHDIDERKGIEDALRWERNFVSAVLDTAGALVIVLDPEGRVVRFNEACQRTTGYSAAEVEGRPFAPLLLPPEERAGVEAVFQRLRGGDFPNSHENHWLTKAGERRLISWSNTALTNGEGEVRFVIATGIDITERQQAEQRLQLYRDLFRHTSDAIVIVDPSDGTVVERNPAHERLSGLSDDQTLGRTITALMGEDHGERIGAALAAGGRFRGELELVNQRQERVAVDVSIFPVKNEAGELINYAGMGRDVTERKRAEGAVARRLRYDEALAACSRALLTEAGDPLQTVLRQLLTPSGAGRVYIFENFACGEHQLCMRQTHEACAENVSAEIENPALQHVPYAEGFSRWRDALSQGEPVQGIVAEFPASEREILEAQGIRSILVLPINVHGQWYGFIGFDDVEQQREWSYDDIRTLRTAGEMVGVFLERRRVEQALRLSEERFRRLVENADDIIYSLGPDGTINYISPTVEEKTGYPPSEFVGRPATAFLGQAQKQLVEDWLARGAHQARALEGLEYYVTHRDGSDRWFSSNASMMWDSSGEMREVIGVAHDITQLRKMLDELQRAHDTLKQKQAQLVQSEKMASLGMLVAGIAHEINTPVGAINSMHQTLLLSAHKLREQLQALCPDAYRDDRKLQRVLQALDEANQVIHSASDRVTNIVRRLRSFARLDEAVLKRIDIHEAIEDTLTILHHELKKSITVTRDYGEVPALPCFPGPLNQVFLNLLMNARQAISGEGEIRIVTRAAEGKATIEIADSGHGMPPEVLRRIFDPGYTTKGVGVGTGLGLSICYQIIQDHRGEITVESEPGRGTTFRVTIPLNLDEILGVDL